MRFLSFKSLTTGAKIFAEWAVKNSPTILTIIGVTAMGAATVKGIIEAPQAKEELDILENDEELSHKDYLREKARVILYHYWLTALLAAGGAGIIFWGHKISLGRTAAALAAYQMSKEDLKKLEDKIVETDGEKKLGKMKNSILKDEVGSGPVNLSTVYNTGHGNMLFYDPIGKRYFLSDIEFIRQQEGEFNFDLAEQMKKGKKVVASFDDWCEYIGLEPLDGSIEIGGNKIKVAKAVGKDLGWRNRLVKLDLTPIKMPDGEFCTVLGYTKRGQPEWDMNISDDYYDDELEDDSTDMNWRK